MAAIHGKDTKPEMVCTVGCGDTWVSVEAPTVTGEARHCDAEIPDVYLRERLFLSRIWGGNATSLELKVLSVVRFRRRIT